MLVQELLLLVPELLLLVPEVLLLLVDGDGVAAVAGIAVNFDARAAFDGLCCCVIVYVAKKDVLSFSVETPNVSPFPHHIILLFLFSEIINVCTNINMYTIAQNKVAEQ